MLMRDEYPPLAQPDVPGLTLVKECGTSMVPPPHEAPVLLKVHDRLSCTACFGQSIGYRVPLIYMAPARVLNILQDIDLVVRGSMRASGDGCNELSALPAHIRRRWCRGFCQRGKNANPTQVKHKKCSSSHCDARDQLQPTMTPTKRHRSSSPIPRRVV